MSDTRDRGRGPGGDRPRRGPSKGFGPKSGERGERRPGKFAGKPDGKSGDKPYRARKEGEAPFKGKGGFGGPRRDDRPGREERPARDDRMTGERKTRFGDRPPREDRPRSFDKPRGFAPRDGDRPEGGRPFRSKPEGRSDKPRAPVRRRSSEPAYSAPLATSPSARGDGSQRVAKAMARAGLCSRRDAELWISEGRVAVNGKVLDSPAVTVLPSDKITVDGVPLAARERTRLFLFHKPRGTVTTDRDPEGRTTIFDVLPEGLPRVVTIGRLDINTEGLLLLTNDGGLARILELPSTGWLRRYRVRAHGDIDQARLDALRGGVEIEGVQYAGIEAVLDRVQGSNAWITMGLREGKNREIKRVLEHLGLAVNRLIRISFGPFQLGELPEGQVEEVRMRVLKEQLGVKLAAEAGVDFTSDVVDRDSDGAPRDRGGDRPLRGRRVAPAETPERLPPPEKPKSAGRKHVGTIRAERDGDKERKRTVTLQTEDRRGRTVAVERREKVKREPEKKERGPSRFRKPEGGAPRRDRAERSEGFEGRAPRAPRSEAPRGRFGGERSERPQGERSNFRRDADRNEGRGQRAFAPRDGERRSFREEGGEQRPSRFPRTRSEDGGERQRSFAPRDGADRRNRDDRPPRRDGGEGRGPRKFEGKPREERGGGFGRGGRSEGDRGGRPGGGFKPRGEGPGGRKGPPRGPGGGPKGRGR